MSALAVQEESRRQGIGSRLVRQMEGYFPGKAMYVFREKHKNQEFYRNLGYSKVDTWVHGKL